jgi:hypothetical protein
MKSYFKFLYYRYFFYNDPTRAWLKHSLKVVIATLLATSIALYQPNVLAMWLVFPTMLMMLMVDISFVLQQRLMIIILQGLLALIAVATISCALIWMHEATYIILSLLVFIALYLGNIKPAYMRTSTLFIIFLLLALAKPIPIEHLAMLSLYLLISVILSLVVMLIIWPLPLKRQIAQLLTATTAMLGRYIFFSINDAIRGNYSLNFRYMIQERLLATFIILKKLEKTYQKVHPNHSLREAVNAVNIAINQAISLENTLNLLPRQSFLYAPLQELQAYNSTIHQLFHESSNNAAIIIPQAIAALTQAWQAQKAVLKTTDVPYIQNLLHWEQVIYVLNELGPSLVTLFKANEAEL